MTRAVPLEQRIFDAVQLPAAPPADQLVRTLAADWRREAGDDSDTDAILQLLLDELRAAAAPLPAPERVDLLRAQVAERTARRINVDSFALAKEALAPGAERAALSVRADALLAHAAAVSQALADIDPARREPVVRELEEVRLECVFVQAGGAMSPRLARWAADHGVEQADGPPDVSP